MQTFELPADGRAETRKIFEQKQTTQQGLRS